MIKFFYIHFIVFFKVDGDPHFVVTLPKTHENLCFTVDGTAGDVLHLLEDPVKGKYYSMQFIHRQL